MPRLVLIKNLLDQFINLCSISSIVFLSKEGQVLCFSGSNYDESISIALMSNIMETMKLATIPVENWTDFNNILIVKCDNGIISIITVGYYLLCFKASNDFPVGLLQELTKIFGQIIYNKFGYKNYKDKLNSSFSIDEKNKKEFNVKINKDFDNDSFNEFE